MWVFSKAFFQIKAGFASSVDEEPVLKCNMHEVQRNISFHHFISLTSDHKVAGFPFSKVYQSSNVSPFLLPSKVCEPSLGADYILCKVEDMLPKLHVLARVP